MSGYQNPLAETGFKMFIEEVKRNFLPVFVFLGNLLTALGKNHCCIVGCRVSLGTL